MDHSTAAVAVIQAVGVKGLSQSIPVITMCPEPGCQFNCAGHCTVPGPSVDPALRCTADNDHRR